MIDLINNTDQDIDISLCIKILKELNIDRDIELVVVNKKDIKKLNKQYRNIDNSTDVLSFPLDDIPNSPLGSIVVNIDKICEKSKELNHTKDEEISLLFLHGVLHLLGYDHETDNGQMRNKEKQIIKKLSLPDSLIVRSN